MCVFGRGAVAADELKLCVLWHAPLLLNFCETFLEDEVNALEFRLLERVERPEERTLPACLFVCDDFAVRENVFRLRRLRELTLEAFSKTGGTRDDIKVSIIISRVSYVSNIKGVCACVTRGWNLNSSGVRSRVGCTRPTTKSVRAAWETGGGMSTHEEGRRTYGHWSGTSSLARVIRADWGLVYQVASGVKTIQQAVNLLRDTAATTTRP